MKIKAPPVYKDEMEEVPHGEVGHFCHGGCAGYAEGGLVKEEPMEQDARVKKELGLKPHTGTDSLLERIPLIGLLRELGKVSQENDRFNNPELLAGKSGPGYQLGTDFQRDSQPFDREADVQMLSEGGIAGVDGMTKNDRPTAAPTETETAGTDPFDLPDDVREYVEAAHKERQESRPDESWRITPAEKPESVAPYKRDEEEEKSDVLENLKSMDLPHYDEGGQVQPGNPQPFDMAQIPPAAAPLDNATVARATAPAPATPPAPALTDQDFMERANKTLGLNPQEQAGFMKLLGSNAQKGQIGAGIAGIGDAIASGGTLGKVNPGALAKSEDLIQGKTKEGIEGMQTIRGNQEKAQELADKLEARDPNSPLSRWAQKAYAGVGKKIGLNLDNASAAMIGDVSGKGVEALKADYEQQLKTMGLNLQSKQIEATIGNQKAEREIAQEGKRLEATKALAARGPLDKVFGIIPGTTSHEVKKSLEQTMEGQKATGPYGQETVRNGKTYEWSPETGKYHLKQ